MVGFRKVIDSVIEHKKPIIAHNSMLDIFHLYSQFVDRLPEDVSLGKKMISSVFPTILDTKLISRDPMLLVCRLFTCFCSQFFRSVILAKCLACFRHRHFPRSI